MRITYVLLLIFFPRKTFYALFVKGEHCWYNIVANISNDLQTGDLVKFLFAERNKGNKKAEKIISVLST